MTWRFRSRVPRLPAPGASSPQASWSRDAWTEGWPRGLWRRVLEARYEFTLVAGSNPRPFRQPSKCQVRSARRGRRIVRRIDHFATAPAKSGAAQSAGQTAIRPTAARQNAPTGREEVREIQTCDSHNVYYGTNTLSQPVRQAHASIHALCWSISYLPRDLKAPHQNPSIRIPSKAGSTFGGSWRFSVA